MKKVNLLATGFFLLLSFTLNAQNYQINSPNDDAEESAGYTVVNLNSPVINLTSDPTDAKFMKQIVGLRFTKVQLQKGTTLAGCYLAFTVDQPANKVSMLAITGEKSGNAQPFQAVNRNISSRPKTIARINWNAVPPWTQAGATMQSPDISKILTEIINLPDWTPGNSIVLMIEGNGLRHATAYDKNPQASIQLVLNGGSIVASAPSAPASSGLGGLSQVAAPAPSSPVVETPAPVNSSGAPASAPSSGNLKSGSSLSETVNTSQAAATLGLANQIQVTIPQGVAPAGTKLTINSVSKEFKYDEIKILNAMDVTLSCGEKFQKPLEIKMYFDKSKLAESGVTKNIRPAYFDEFQKQWVQYDDYSINEQEGSVSFNTNHLTTLSLFEFITTGFYSMKFENEDCTVFYSVYDTHKPMPNSEYNDFKEETWYIKESDKERKKDYYAPYMVQDIAHWLSEAKKAFKNEPHELWVPKGKVNIYVKQIPNDEAEGKYHPIYNCIYIHNNQKSAPLKPNQNIKSLVPHEFLHLIEDNYYFMEADPKQIAELVTGSKAVLDKVSLSSWWFEALAIQADAMVFDIKDTVALPLPECEKLAKEWAGVSSSIVKSWDSGDKYEAGLFLYYLTNYRPGGKFNIGLLLKHAGLDLDWNNFRTILDNKLKKVYESSISKEFEDYAKWTYQNTDSKYIRFDPKSATDNTVIKIPENFVSKDLKEELPYLSAKIVKLRLDGANAKEVKVETIVKSIDKGIKLFLCDIDLKTGKPKVIREMKVTAPDSSGMTWTTNTTLNQKYKYTNILVVNTNKDDAGSFNIEVKNLVQPKP